MIFLGIDVGTSACKTCAYDENGTLLLKKQASYTIRHPQSGWAEVDALEMKHAVLSLLKDMANKLPQNITSIAVSSQGEGIVALQSDMTPCSPIILSYDKRNQNEYLELEKQFGRENIFNISGQINSTALSAGKIKWLTKQGIKADRFCCVGDYITACLCGTPLIDYSLAARTMLLNVHTLQWEPDFLNALQISENQLSCAVQAGSGMHTISKEAAKFTGISDRCIITAGGHDQACGMYGACDDHANSIYYSIGTTETLVCMFDRFHHDLFQYGLPCYPHVLKNRFLSLPGNYTGAVILEWYKNTLYQTQPEEDSAIYQEMIQNMSGTPSTLLVLPYFTISGSPYHDPNSLGSIIGLKLSTDGTEIIRGLLEGCTMEIAYNIELMESLHIRCDTLITSGTISKYSNIMQLKSDVLNRPIMRYQDFDAACMGAAKLAANAVGLATQHWNNNRKHSMFTPHPEYAEYYKKQLVKYKKIYPAVKEICSDTV